jgi:hypothetical protein
MYKYKRIKENFHISSKMGNILCQCHSFVFLFHRLVLRRLHFTCSNLAWGLYGGVDMKFCFFWSCINVIVTDYRVNVSRGTATFSQRGSTVRTQVNRPLAMGRFTIYMDKLHLPQMGRPGSSTVTSSTDRSGILHPQALSNILHAYMRNLPFLTVYLSTRREEEMEKAKEEVKTWNLDLG